MHCYFQKFADLYAILKSENPTLNADDIERKVRIMRITCIVIAIYTTNISLCDNRPRNGLNCLLH